MAGSILKWWFSKNRCFFTRWIQRNPSEKTILSCSLTPRPFFALVGTATLLKRQNAIIPKRIFQERDPFFLQNVRSSVRMPLANSFSHLYSKFAFFLKQLDFNCPWACQMNYFFAEVRKSGVHQTPTLHKGKRDFEWVFVDESPPPSLKTLVMLQSDPTRIPTELIRIDVR